MKKLDVIKSILGNRHKKSPTKSSVQAFAPTNIALCKYWGKRNQELNLPMTSSLSISLGNKGATTELKITENKFDSIILNNQSIDLSSPFSKRLIEFLNLFRVPDTLSFQVTIHSNIPIAAGLASSASGFAAIVQTLNSLFDWQLQPHELSILARLGSGSACRSIWPGFVEWREGNRADGMDSYGEAMIEQWPDLCIGLLILHDGEKPVSSREAMQRTVATSALYSAWPQKVNKDLSVLKDAISSKEFNLLGKTAESNALAMHATMLAAWPPIHYALPESVQAMQKIWNLRKEGLSLYFTQDAGPNLKLLFLKKDLAAICHHFSTVEIIQPFERSYPLRLK